MSGQFHYGYTHSHYYILLFRVLPDSDKLEPMVMVVKYKEDCEPEYDNTKDKEEPDEILHIVSEVRV